MKDQIQISGIGRTPLALAVFAAITLVLLPAAWATPLVWNLPGNGNWNTTTPNWTGASTTFTDDGTVDVAFTNAAGGTITIVANMSPLSTTVNSTGTYQFNGGPIDFGSLSKSGAGLLTLNSANTYPGGSQIKAGTIQLYHANAAGPGTITVGDGTGSAAATLYVVANITNAIAVQSGTTGPLTLRSDSADGRTLSGPITLANNLAVYHVGDRDTHLDGNITGIGNLTLTNASATTRGQYLRLRMASVNTVGNIQIGGIGYVLISAAIGGNVMDITQDNSSFVTYSGVNTYTGATTVNAGTLKFSKLAAWSQNFGGVSSTPTPITISNAGSVLALSYGGTGEFADANIVNILANTTFGVGTGLALDTTSANATLNTTLGNGFNNPQNLTKLGANTLTLTGANTYTGTTTLTPDNYGNGILVAGVAEVVGVSGPFGNPATPAGSIVFDGGGFGWSAANTTDYSPRFAVNSGKGYGFNTGGQTVTLASALPVNGVNGLSKGGDGTLILTGTNLYTGVTTVGRGTLSVSSLNNIASPLVGSNLGRPTTSANGQITIGSRDVASPVLLYTGTGETTDRLVKLGQDDHNQGGTIDQSGTGLLKFSGDATTGIAVTTADGGPSLTLRGSTAGVGEISGVIQKAGGATLAVTKSGTNTWTLSGANRYNGVTTISTGILSINTLSHRALTPTLTTTTGSATVTASSTAGLLAGQTIVSLKIPAGTTIASITDGTTLVLSSGTSVTAGTAQASNIGFANSLGLPALANATIAMGSGNTTGQLTYTGLAATTDRAINLAGTTGGATLDQSGTGLLKFTSAFTATGAGSKTLTLQGSTSGTGEIGAAIVNNSSVNKTSLIKLGTGTWILSGVNTYTGPTTVSEGTLGGTGTIAGAVTVAADAALAPGPLNGIGTLTVGGGVTFADGAHLNVDASGETADLLSVVGSVTGAGTVTVVPTAAGNGPWTIMTATSIAPTFVSADPDYVVKKLNGDTQLRLMKIPGTVFVIR